MPKRPRANRNNALAARQQQQAQPSVPNFQVVASSFQGPIPPPDVLRGYEDVLPGSVDRILRMAENQTSHRIDIEGYAVRAEGKRADRGQALAFAVVAGFIAAGVFLINGGHSTQGLVLGLGPTASIGGLFVYSNQSRKGEREMRMRMLSGQQPQSRRR